MKITRNSGDKEEYLLNINGGKKEGTEEKGQMHQMEHNQQNDSKIQWYQ